MLTLEDRIEIIELGAAFAALLDQRRFPEVAVLFAQDGELHRADGSLVQGREAIHAAQASRHESVHTVHHVSVPLIETAAGGAVTGRTNFVAVSVDMRDGSSQGWVIGHFEDRYRQDDGPWRFASRRIHILHRR